MPYIHENQDWPDFDWDVEALLPLVGDLRLAQGRLLERVSGFDPNMQQQVSLSNLTREVETSAAIEGATYDAAVVRSSVARRLGIDDVANVPRNRHVDGIVDVMVDAVTNFAEPLTKARLCAWQTALFPEGRSGLTPITIGDWRDDARGPMQVVSGRIGRETVHYEAPAHDRLDTEVGRFLEWFNRPDEGDSVIRSGLAHFWFVTLHPFSDGNGRIARAIGEMVLAAGDDSAIRYYSLSAQILRDREQYYRVLETTQKGDLDLTDWLVWYLTTAKSAIDHALDELAAAHARQTFWQRHAHRPFNPRQRKMLSRLLDGYDGKLTTSKWAKSNRCSQDTALRDLQELVDWHILERSQAGGRSTHYRLFESSPTAQA